MFIVHEITGTVKNLLLYRQIYILFADEGKICQEIIISKIKELNPNSA